ncbi:MAG: phosphotransferase, partial [Pseudomonadota bacterium]
NLPALRHHIGNLCGQDVQEITSARLGRGDDRWLSLSSVTRLRVKLSDNRTLNLVLRQPKPGPFGLEEREDIARQCLLSYRSFSATPKHPKALDIGMVDDQGAVVSLANGSDFFLLEEFVEGENYGDTDFTAMREEKAVTPRESRRAELFAAYLAELHRERPEGDPLRYRRSVREIFAGGEGLMGILDSFSDTFFETHRDRLCCLEHACLETARRLRDRPGRLSVTHGDFHPWNILFRGDEDFTAIDKSRCHLNDPAIDVGAMLMSYLMLALWQGDWMQAPATQLARHFLRTYVDATGDDEILTTLPLYTAMRAAAAASPEFYPEMPETLREKAFDLAIVIARQDVLDTDLRTLDQNFDTTS